MKRVCAILLCLVAFWRIAPSDAASPELLAPTVNEMSFQPAETLPGPPQPYIDFDRYELEEVAGEPYLASDEWVWQSLPTGTIYGSYLAGTKESRASGNFVNMKDDGWLWDASLGYRVGLLRLGTVGGPLPDGFQIDCEGSAQVRLDMPENIDVRSVDFRGGMPLTYGSGPSRWKFGYYHLSSHLGDEFLIANPGYPRLNFVRDVLIAGHMRYLTPKLRVYGEVGWAFNVEVSEPWEFQFGMDYAPFGPTGTRGAPFFAINGHLREELDFSGALTVQTGWAWRSDVSTPLLRAGVHYYNGLSNQYSFYREHEQQFGLAVWYDF